MIGFSTNSLYQTNIHKRCLDTIMADLRSGVKWLLFFSSYIPLYLILAIKHRDILIALPEVAFPVIGSNSIVQFPIVTFGWILLAFLSGVFLKLVFDLRKSRGGTGFKDIDSYRNRDDLITNYILVYIFPFVVLEFTNLENWLAFLLFFIVIGIVQVRSNHLYVNPILSLFNYHIYEVDTGDEVLTVLTKGKIGDSVERVRTVELSNDVHLTI